MPSEELDEYFARMFRPGAVILTSGFKGGGKSHTAIAVAEQLIEGMYPSVGKVEVFTNILFFHNVNGRIVEEAPEHVHIVTTMKDLFPLLMDSIESNGRSVLNLLILDEAQGFIGGDSNQTNASVMMKEMLGIIRKFRLAVWFLTPSARSIGPAFRNWLNDPRYPGNLTARFMKDLAWNEKYIEQMHLNINPQSLMQVKNFDSDPILLVVPITEWTQTRDNLKPGEYCYDHEASATFYVGEDFDWEKFNRTIGGVSSLRVMETIRRYYRENHSGEGTGAPLTPEEAQKRTQAQIAKRMLDEGASQRDVAKALGVSHTTVANRMKEYGGKAITDTANDAQKHVEITRKKAVSGDFERLPKKPLASTSGKWQLEGGKSPPIYISKKKADIGRFSRGEVATSNSPNEDEEGDLAEHRGTPIPDGRYTFGEMCRAVHHCIGDDTE